MFRALGYNSGKQFYNNLHSMMMQLNQRLRPKPTLKTQPIYNQKSAIKYLSLHVKIKL